jgi:hypothetical protein
MDRRLSESPGKAKETKNQAAPAWLRVVEQPQPDLVLRTELIEVTA